MTANKIMELRNKLMPVIKKNELNKVVLFGSRARGDNRVDSDYDFLIESKDVMGMFELSGLFQDLEEILQSHVDIVVQPKNCLTKIDHYLMEDISRDGVLVYAG